MEDEECLPENSPLKLYLQDIGYSDVEVTKKTKSAPAKIKLELSKSKSKCRPTETLDEEIIQQIEILVSTQMLFEEDVSDIEKLLSNFKVVKNGMLKSMFQGIFGVSVVFFGLCLFWIIGGYAFIIVSSFYAYNAAYYLTKKHFTQKQLKKLATVLQTNFLLLKNTVKFIEENNKVLGLNNTGLEGMTDHITEGFQFYNSFRDDFFMSIKEMICILTNSTQKLISEFPLCEYMENPQYYLCNNLNKNCYESVDLCKLYQIYLLVQSEFLQRLILSLIPNIKLSSTDNFKELNKTVTETCVGLLKIKNKLNKKFKFVFLNGIHCPKSKVELKLPPKFKVPSINYAEEFAANIRDTSNYFQNLLIKSRIIEENIRSKKIPQNIEEELSHIQNDLNICLRNIEDSFILLKKANSVTDKKEIIKIEENTIQKPEERSEGIPVGFTDLDPKIEDEIFEAYFSGEKIGTDLCNLDDWDFEDRLKKKLEKEYSKNVIKELKLKIVERAKKWEEKEAELLKMKKPINESVEIKNNSLEQPDLNFNKISNDNDSNNKTNQTEGSLDSSTLLNDNSEVDNEKYKNYKKILGEEQNSIGQNLINKTILLEELNTNENKNYFEELPVSYLGVLDKNFFTDLSQARQKILNVSDNSGEEFFCDGEDSTEEELENN